MEQRDGEGKGRIRLALENGEGEEVWLEDNCVDQSKGRTSSNPETFGLLDLFSLGQN